MIPISQLSNTGQLKIAGFLDEEMPAVRNGLKSLWPLRTNFSGRKYANILPYENWVIGSVGSQSFFSQNGETACNSIIEGLDPWGRPTAVWRSLNNDVASNSDGGWNTSQFAVDPAYKYRFTTWMKRTVRGNGSFYLGCHGYASGVNNIYYEHSTSTTTNPYFLATSWWYELDQWFLFVGYVHEIGYGTGHHAESGVWWPSGTKRANISHDFQWMPGTTTANHRSYLYYSTDPATNQQWCYPRVDKIDGTQPSLEDLLNGKAYGVEPPAIATNLAPSIMGLGINEDVTNNADLAYNSGWNNSGTSTRKSNDQEIGRLFPSTQVHSIEQLTTGNSALLIANHYASVSTQYCASVWAYFDCEDTDTGSFPYLRQYYTGANNSLGVLYYYRPDGTYTSSWASVPKRQWIRLHRNVVVTRSDATHLRICLYTNTAGMKVYLTAPKIEKNPFVTQFTEIAPSAPGMLAVPLNAGSYGTITFNVVKRYHSTVGSNINGAFISCNNTRLYVYTGNTETLQLWATDATGGEANRITQANAIQLNKTFRVTIVWNTSTIEMFLDGISCGSYASFGYSYLAGQNLYVGSESTNGRSGNCMITDLAIFNRAFSAIDVLRLSQKTRQLSANGDMHNVIEEVDPILLPTTMMNLHSDGQLDVGEFIEGL